MATYALKPTDTETIVLPKGAVVKHICGEKLVPVEKTGRFSCARCLQSGYLLPV